MTGNKIVTTMVLAIALVSVIAAPAAAFTPDTGIAQQNNTTTATPTPTPTETATETGCEPGPSEPSLQKARLYTSERVINAEQPGEISGTITVDIQNECPVVVQVTLGVPSGMQIEGSSDISSGGGGTITNTFEVAPGETKSIRADVYSNEVGSKTVISEITYYPKGHKEMAREIDGQMLDFQVQEPNSPGSTAENTPTSGGTGENESAAGSSSDGPGEGGAGGDSITEWLFGLVGITQIGLLVLVGLGLIMVTKAVPDTLDIDLEFLKK